MCAPVFPTCRCMGHTREGSARGRCRGGWFSTGRELSFCRNKTRLSNQARAKLMGQQPLSPLWNARIYQRAEVALRAKDFPIVTGFSGAFSSTSAMFHSPCPLRTPVDKFDRVKMHFSCSFFRSSSALRGACAYPASITLQ